MNGSALRIAFLVVAILGVCATAAAIEIRGLHIYGGSNETHLPIVVLPRSSAYGNTYSSIGDPFITIDFDVDSPLEPVLKLIFVHCSRDWNPDWNIFDDNFMNLQATDVHGMRADPQIMHYAYHYSLRFPDSSRRVTFTYSGNYKAMILDGADTVAEGRFFVVDQLANVNVTIYNDVDYALTPARQVHNVEADVTAAPEIFQMAVEGASIVQNHRFRSFRRVDPGDTSGNSQISVTGSYMRFIAQNMIPGNAYRVLDITDPGLFPPSNFPVAFVPKDIVRTGLSAVGDYGGSEILNGVPSNYSDYLPIQFRLDAGGERKDDVFLVGAFNDWTPSPETQMQYDPKDGVYECVVWLKRGVYDYQYVTGTIEPSKRSVVGQNWTVLEGNSWNAPVKYTALIYYRDERYGGIDRIIGCGSN